MMILMMMAMLMILMIRISKRQKPVLDPTFLDSNKFSDFLDAPQDSSNVTPLVSLVIEAPNSQHSWQ